jgi:hypothetical protein
LRSPVSLTLSMKFDLGPTVQRQSLAQQLDYGRVQPGQRLPESAFRSFGSSGISNPMSSILRSQDSLRLTSLQADSIASMNRRYAYRADSIWTGAARYLASLPKDYRDDEAYDRYLRARRAQIDLLIIASKALRELLSPEQIRKLPAFTTSSFDPRYLESIRNGSGLYVPASGGGGGPFFEFAR